jgi:hypothetical protein
MVTVKFPENRIKRNKTQHGSREKGSRTVLCFIAPYRNLTVYVSNGMGALLGLLEKQSRSVVMDVFIKSITSPKCLDEESLDGGK